MEKRKNYVIILAGGVGSRLEKKINKQFIKLGNYPIVMHTISAFYHSLIKPEIILVLPRCSFKQWEDLCDKYNFKISCRLVEGGDERFHSVKNALAALPDRGFVGIHDAVRPFVSERLINEAYNVAWKLGNAVPAVPATNTIRYFDEKDVSRSLDRRHVYIVQNPQVFTIREIKSAYKQNYDLLFTDDAAVAEKAGITINLIEGDRKNIKITYPIDITIAQGIYEHYYRRD